MKRAIVENEQSGCHGEIKGEGGELSKRGVRHAALFGSLARGEDTPERDSDVMIEIDPNAHIGVWGYASVKAYIAALFDGPVDVIDREALKPFIKTVATADAVYAF